MEKPYRKANYNGMNWITQKKRLAIYLRDGLSCCYCGESVEDGASLTLDHVLPVIKGGTNDASNLVTSCFRCNLHKGKRNLAPFSRAVAAYLDHNVQAITIQKHVLHQVKQSLPLDQAESLIGLRGSAARVLAAVREENQ
jgi:5-methylcytosine-specific restriction endonuclease McrA